MSKPFWQFSLDADGTFHLMSEDWFYSLESPPDTGPTRWPQNRVIGFMLMEYAGLRDYDADIAKDEYFKREWGG
jgi:hypothetical protein